MTVIPQPFITEAFYTGQIKHKNTEEPQPKTENNRGMNQTTCQSNGHSSVQSK